jgi:hypothetical protein
MATTTITKAPRIPPTSAGINNPPDGDGDAPFVSTVSMPSTSTLVVGDGSETSDTSIPLLSVVLLLPIGGNNGVVVVVVVCVVVVMLLATSLVDNNSVVVVVVGLNNNVTVVFVEFPPSGNPPSLDIGIGLVGLGATVTVHIGLGIGQVQSSRLAGQDCKSINKHENCANATHQTICLCRRKVKKTGELK